MTDRVLWGSGTAGTVLEAGLPEIYGKLTNVVKYGWIDATGAFKSVGTGSFSGAGTSGFGYQHLDFSAARYNAIYGNSETVQPPSVSIRFCIKY